MSLSSPNARAYLALSLAALFEVGLFADSLYERWENVIAPMNQPADQLGEAARIPTRSASEGLVIRGNGLGYYAWLRSLLIDHDWDFANEFDEHPVPGDWVPPPTYRHFARPSRAALAAIFMTFGSNYYLLQHPGRASRWLRALK